MTAAADSRWPLRRQWFGLLIGLIVATSVTIATDILWRANNIVYDLSMPSAPAPDDLLIVAIDDASVAELGRWPWRRATLALGLEQLAALAPRAVLLDVLLLEEDNASAGDDELLAAALDRTRPTVLPLALERHPRTGGLAEVLPIEPLRSAAGGLGHVHLEIDRDGIARSVFLREGLGEPRWSHLALATLEALGETPRGGLRGERHPAPSAGSDRWMRDYRVRIPFLGPPGHIRQVPFAELLRGSLAPEQIRGKTLLIGATAQGLGDSYPTPRSGESRTMAGVEITANVLAMLRSGVLLRDVPPGWQHGVSALVLLVLFWGFLRLSPRGSLVLVVVMLVLVASGAYWLLQAGHWWFAPAPLLAAIAIAYPLWSWRRLEATQRFLDEELTQVARDTDAIDAMKQPAGRASLERFGDVVEHRIALARQAAARLRTLRRFLAATIANLPDGTLVVSAEGRILLANGRAGTLLQVSDHRTLPGQSAQTVLAPLLREVGESFDALAARAPYALEVRDSAGRDLLVDIARFVHEESSTASLIVVLADVTPLKRALRERQDLMRFLSHDMRSPATSLVALARLQQVPQRALATPEFAAQVESLATRSLALTEGFLALARAEAASTRDFAPLDLSDVVRIARDEVWAAAEAKRITLTAKLPEEAIWVDGSVDLLTRAIVNLLANAVKYTQLNGQVGVRVERRASETGVIVRDNGPGIAVDKQSGLFVPFQRAVPVDAPDPGGLGLGLAFVRLVAEKHRGRTEVHSVPGEGATFELWLPLAPAPDAAAR